MKQQESNNELIILFDDVKETKVPWNYDIKKLLAMIEKEKKKQKQG